MHKSHAFDFLNFGRLALTITQIVQLGAANFTMADQFNVGDTVRVWVKVVEGNRERLQAFEGTVIAKRNGGIRETFTVRKNSNGVGVEKTFPIHSPLVEKIELVRRGRVRRARLHYMRQRTGKSAKIKARKD